MSDILSLEQIISANLNLKRICLLGLGMSIVCSTYVWPFKSNDRPNDDL